MLQRIPLSASFHARESVKFLKMQAVNLVLLEEYFYRSLQEIESMKDKLDV